MRPGRRQNNRRILILVQNLPVPFDRRVWQESKALQGAGYDVTVVSPSDDRHPPVDDEIDGIRVIRYPAPLEAEHGHQYIVEYGWALFALLRGALRARRRGPFAAVHYCNPPDLLFLVGLVLKILDGTRTVFDQHDLGPELIKAKRLPLNPLLVFFARLIERLTYATSEFVISTNHSYRRAAIQRGHKRADRVRVVRSGPDENWAIPVPQDLTLRRGRRHHLAYLGVMGRQEGIEYLLQAVQHLVVGSGLDLHVTLIGSGPDRDRLQTLASDMGLAERVEFTGRVSDEELRTILCSADVCVNPDEFNELNDLSTMNKIVEYMAMGRPIVQFDLTEGRFSAGEASLYARRNDSIDFARCIEKLLNDADLRSRMGALAARRFREELSWERQAAELVDFYGRIAPG